MKLYHIFMSSPDVLRNLVAIAIIVTLPSYQYLSFPLPHCYCCHFPCELETYNLFQYPCNLPFDFLFDVRLTSYVDHFSTPLYFVGW